MSELISKKDLIHGLMKNYEKCMTFNDLLNFIQELPSCKNQIDWNSCSERLPEEDSIRVYVTLEHNESGYKHVRRMLYFYGRFENSNGSSVSKEFKVIAWTPERIPQPYKGE